MYRDTKTSYSPLCPLLFQCPLELETADELELHPLIRGICSSEGGKILVLNKVEIEGLACHLIYLAG